MSDADILDDKTPSFTWTARVARIDWIDLCRCRSFLQPEDCTI